MLRDGEIGEVYNIGSGEERTNLEMTEAIHDAVDGSTEQISFVDDRTGPYQRYALETDKIERLGWEPSWSFEEGLERAIDYCL